MHPVNMGFTYCQSSPRLGMGDTQACLAIFPGRSLSEGQCPLTLSTRIPFLLLSSSMALSSMRAGTRGGWVMFTPVTPWSEMLPGVVCSNAWQIIIYHLLRIDGASLVAQG